MTNEIVLHNDFPDTAERFIAYFDIMGFKDLIYRNDHATVSGVMDYVSDHIANMHERETSYLQIPPEEKTHDIQKGITLPVMFSDSILFVSRGADIHDLKKITYAASYFLYKMFKKEIGVKGALAFGTFTADFESSKFYGRPLVDAYLLAEETQFYGAPLHHSFENRLSTYEDQPLNKLLKKKQIPMKGGGNILHTFVDWQIHLNVEEPPGKMNLVLEKLYKGVSGSTRRYVDNTVALYGA